MATDALLGAADVPAFTWGRRLGAPSHARADYLAALRAGDGRDYGPLPAFVRS